MVGLPTRSFASTRQQHLDDQNGYIRNMTLESVNSLDYATLQLAAADAITFGLPLVIAPKTYTERLLISGASDLHVFAYGAKLVASGNITSLVELKNCTRCSWHGGWLAIPNGATVTNALYVYSDSGQSTRNTFYDMTIDGHYGAGVRVGEINNADQCDHHHFENIEFIGRDNVGQVGIYCGTDVYGNCLNHTFDDLMISHHDKGAVISAANAYLSNVFFDTNNVDLYINSTALSLQNVRSEDSKRFMDDGGVVNAGANISIRDVLWNAQSIHADGHWIKSNIAGALTLDNVRVVNAAVRPVISCQTGAQKVVHVRGLTEGGGAVACPYEGAFDVNGNVAVKTDSYLELNSDGIVASITA